MRIGQLIQTVDVRSGGTSTAFLNSLAALGTRPGLNVRAYAVEPPADDPVWGTINGARGAWSLASGCGHTLSPGTLGRAVAADVAAGGMDVLHIHGLWSPDLLAAARACLRHGTPYVWEPHGMLVREAYAQKRLKKEIFMALGMRRALKGAAGLVLVTEEERDHSLIPAGIRPDRVSVVPLPVLMPKATVDAGYRRAARARFGVPEHAPCVVFMGRLHPVKRVEMILEAAAGLSRRQPELRVLLIGGGEDAYTRTLRDRAASLGLGERAIFAGWAQGDDKWLALAAGDVLTLNSVHENFGFVAVEALCVGTMPVLTSNLAIAAEMKAGRVAEVAEPDAGALAAAWARAIEGNGGIGGLAVMGRGREWVRANLSVEAIGEKLETLYSSVTATRGRG